MVARTLKNAVTVTGVGIHTGADARVTLCPEAPDYGLMFVRMRAESGNNQPIPARSYNVGDTTRCTVLSDGGESISTVEHLLSACAGLGVTDLRIEVDGPELPIGDGSARIWTDAFAEAGLTGDAGAPPTLAEPLILTGKGGAFIAAYPSERLSLTVSIHFDHPLVGTQIARFVPSTDDYVTQVAPARTFGFIEEVEQLIAAGLARGGSFDNAVVIYPDRTSSPLRFPNEMARHKLLDLMGDLRLAGALPQADIIAVKPSHRLNTLFAARLAQSLGNRPNGLPLTKQGLDTPLAAG